MSMRIRRLVDEVDEQHREGMRTIESDLAAVHVDDTDAALTASRRNFMRNLGVGAVAFGSVAVAGVALAEGAAAQSATATAPPDLPQADLQLALFAQGLELAAAAAYDAAIATRVLDAPSTEIARTFARHHRDHAQALGALAPKDQNVTTPNAAVVKAVGPQIQSAGNQNGILTILYGVEEGAAATYLRALGVVDSWLVAGPAATILPIESQHAVVLGQLTGQPESTWMPAFGTTTAAFDPAKYPAS